MPVRKPHVAGSFYPANSSELRQFCQTHLTSAVQPRKARAVILPHAGYIYSGKTAGLVLSRVSIPENVFLIGPNHFGSGSPFALVSKGQWETPLGQVSIETRFAAEILKAVPQIQADEPAHRYEHSLEVEIPFLQVKNPAVKIIPLIVGTLDLESARQTALALGDCLAGRPADSWLIVISTDMNHYESDEATRKKDRFALDAIENLDAGGLVRAVRNHRITMCGFVPVYMMLVMAGKLGIKKAELVNYTTSAEASGDTDRVVGYAGFVLQ